MSKAKDSSERVIAAAHAWAEAFNRGDSKANPVPTLNFAAEIIYEHE